MNSLYEIACQSMKAAQFIAVIESDDSLRDEKYMSCLHLYTIYSQLGSMDKAHRILEDSYSIDPERVEGIYILIRHYTCVNNSTKALEYYRWIQSYYENRYVTDMSIQTRLGFKQSDYDFYLPYFMIIVAERMKDYAIGFRMYYFLFRQKCVNTTDFYIGNLLFNFQFFIPHIQKSHKSHTDFVNSFIEYLNCLYDAHFTVNTEQIKDYICRFDLARYKNIRFLENGLFTRNQCRQSKSILIYTGFSETQWNYTKMLERGIGGSEMCAIRIAEQFPSDTQVYIAGGVIQETVENIHFIDFYNIEDLLKTTPFYAVIISRYIGFLDDYVFSTYKLYLWIHDLHILPYAWNRTLDIPTVLQKWNHRINKYICLTEWHCRHIQSEYPQIANKIIILPNGVTSSVFPLHPMKKINRFIFTSRPERGYARVFELWNDILSKLPDAELKLATYGKFPSNPNEESFMAHIQKTPSIEFVGCLNQARLYELMSTADYWLYPTDFSETFCITGIEMLHSQVICIYYPVAALKNTVGDYGIPVSHGDELNTILSLTEDNKESMRLRGLEYAKTFDWTNVFMKWKSELFEAEQPLHIGVGWTYPTLFTNP